jgi:putative FmdB family regulatory protein
MPIYEFDCAACGHVFERLQKLSDADPSDCPACNAAAVKRRVSAPSFRLAGGGWYETDFKSDKDKKRNLAGGDDGGKSSGGDGAAKSGDAKPAASDAKPSTASSTASATASTTAAS